MKRRVLAIIGMTFICAAAFAASHTVQIGSFTNKTVVTDYQIIDLDIYKAEEVSEIFSGNPNVVLACTEGTKLSFNFILKGDVIETDIPEEALYRGSCEIISIFACFLFIS